MILNVLYNNKEFIKKIDLELGKFFLLKEWIKMGGIGFLKLMIIEISVYIYNLFILDNNWNVCNIELCFNGIFVGFWFLLELYVLVILYYKFSFYKGKVDEYFIYRDNYFVKIEVKVKDRSVYWFMNWILELKNNIFFFRIEDI